MNLELFDQVKEFIREQPHHVEMSSWCDAPEDDDKNFDEMQLTDCGTVACISGIAAWLAKPEQWPANSTEGEKYLGNTNLDLFHVEYWPKEWRDKYRAEKDKEKKAEILCEVIDDYIDTNQWSNTVPMEEV